VIALLFSLLASTADTIPAPSRDTPSRDTPSRDTPSRDTLPADTAVIVKVSGFVDGYVAWDTHRPRSLDRAYTTAASRHSEFNINLAYLDATLSGRRLRGRFAAQFGTSVQANYAAEPRVGSNSGPDVSRFIQEAYVGYQLRPSVWVDAGVFFAPFGAENWISRDNPVYTRSLIADNSPYYESGVRLAWQARPSLQLQAHVINGWQNISETNQSKAVALRADWTPTARLTLTYDTFLGNEQPDSVAARWRQFHEGIVKLSIAPRTAVAATLDYGMQARATGTGRDSWRGYALLLRHDLTDAIGLGARLEGYSDPAQVIVSTGGPSGLRASGGSLNVDLRLHPHAVWRSEWRQLGARDAVFPSGAAGRVRTNAALITSLALTF
jgi:hypothetical protein